MSPAAGLLEAPIMVNVRVDGDDVVRALEHNDESTLLFIVQMLEAADSVDLRDRLAERLRDWNADRATT